MQILNCHPALSIYLNRDRPASALGLVYPTSYASLEEIALGNQNPRFMVGLQCTSVILKISNSAFWFSSFFTLVQINNVQQMEVELPAPTTKDYHGPHVSQRFQV